MKVGLFSIVTFLAIWGNGWAYDRDRFGAYDSERLFERAKQAVESSKESRREVAEESSRRGVSRNLASDLDEEDVRWQREVDGILRE